MVTSGVVTAIYGNNGACRPTVLRDSERHRTNSAIWVIGDGVAVGDQVEVAGSVNEVFGLRQILSAVPTVQSSGNALPAAETLDLVPINDEQWECVLVQMEGTVSGITANFGEWNLSDGTGQGMAASFGYNAVNDSILVDGVNHNGACGRRIATTA